MRTIIFLCLLFFTAVALDVSPLLRGPSISEWRWPYEFVNTSSKLVFPLIPAALILILFWLSEKIKKPWLILTMLVILSFGWQLSVIHFSRAGIKVLYHRTTDSGLNGYYSAGINIKDPREFVTSYPQIVNDLPMHAKGHPPGMPLAFYYYNRLISDPFIVAISSPFIISFVSGLAIVLVYLITKSLTSAFFTATIPGLALFLPLPDVIYPLFGLFALVLLKKFPVVSGLIFGLGLFFSYSILPVIIFFRKSKFILGLIIMVLIYYLIGYDFFKSTMVIISNQAHRSFLPWLLYNPYDFVVFLGIPLAVLAWKSAKNKLLVIMFFVFLTIFSRAEVGRIWLPLAVMLPILIKQKLSTKSVMILFALQMIQTLVIQEFWVPLW